MRKIGLKFYIWNIPLQT